MDGYCPLADEQPRDEDRGVERAAQETEGSGTIENLQYLITGVL